MENLSTDQNRDIPLPLIKPDWNTLTQQGTRIIEPLIECLNTDLSNTWTERLLWWLLPLNHKAVRSNAALVLGRIKHPKAVEPLIATLHDKYGVVRSKAAEALGQIGDARAVSALKACLNDHEATVHNKAAEALLKICES